MTALLLTACVGMITGAFLIFRISPMDFTLGVFRRLTAGPKSIRDDINETTQRKKPGFFRREISEAQTILRATGKEERFPVLCAASLLLFAVGAGIAIIMNNLLLVPVLAAGMMFLPFWYIKLTAGHYRKAVTAELETALSIITTAYLRSEDLQTAVEENINYLNPPVQGVFRSFLTRIKHIDPDMNAALAELKSAIDNEVWREWCEALSACQYDHSMKSTLKLNFYVDADFDVDAAFGTFVLTDKNDDWLNIYANYDIAEDRPCDTLELTLCKGDGSEESWSYPLNAAEQEVLMRKMEEFCQQQTGMSLREYAQQLHEEQAQTAELQL